MFGLFKDVAALAAKRAVKAWPAALALVLYFLVLRFAFAAVGPLGVAGGLVTSLVVAACVASYLHLVALAVEGLAVKPDDVVRGLRERFWDVVSVLFAIWIISLGAALLTSAVGRQGEALAAVIALAMAFFLNPVPELIYGGRTRSFELLGASARFVFANPVVWFAPNLLFAAALLAPAGLLQVGHPAELLVLFSHVFSARGVLVVFGGVPLAFLPLLLAIVHYAMIFRGLLFRELASGGPRSRAFRARLR